MPWSTSLPLTSLPLTSLPLTSLPLYTHFRLSPRACLHVRFGKIGAARWSATTSSSNVHRPAVPPANGTMTTTTCSATASSLGGSRRRPLCQLACRGRGRWPFGHHEDRTPTHGYAATREAALLEAALAAAERL